MKLRDYKERVQCRTSLLLMFLPDARRTWWSKQVLETGEVV